MCYAIQIYRRQAVGVDARKGRTLDETTMDTALKSALLAILRPLVRYIIGRGWSYPALCEMLKEVYVSEAETQYAPSTVAVTDSRISLLTGIHRKDVKRLRTKQAEHPDAPALRRGASLAARVVAAWMATPRYLDVRRRPKILPLTDTRDRPSFESLVRETKADMRATVILEELLRVGVAEILDNDSRVRLLRNAYVSDLPRDKIAFLGDNLGDHLQSALHNISGIGSPYIERAVYYELIEPEALDQLRPELFHLSEQFLQTVNAKVMPLNAQAIRRRENHGRRMRLGVFYYEDDSRLIDRNASTPVKAKRDKKQ